MAATSLASAQTTDFDTILQRRLAARLSGTMPAVSTVEGHLATQQSDGRWTNLDYALRTDNQWHTAASPFQHLRRMSDMARRYAWSDAGNPLYHSPELKTAYLKAFDYWISRNPRSDNWWWNEIGSPIELGVSMLLMKAEFSAAQLTAGDGRLANAKLNFTGADGTNLIDKAGVYLDRGLIKNNTTMVSDAFRAVGLTLNVRPGDGIQKDSTYQLAVHGRQLYIWGYGSLYLNGIKDFQTLGNGTALGFSQTQIERYIDHMLDGPQWFIRGVAVDATASGRGVAGGGVSSGGNYFATILQGVIAWNNSYRLAELQAFHARLIDARSSAPNPGLSLVGNRHFWNSDATVHQRPAFYSSVRISSVRTTQPELVNGGGLRSLYLADGVNQVMSTGHEYDDIYPVWNWYRLPGTTVEQNGRDLKPAGIPTGTATYAGGVSDRLYGATAFNYSRYNVAAKKSWFFFEDEFAALGAAINGPNATSPVLTTINQCLLRGPVTYRTASGPQTLALGSSVTPAGLQWVHHDGVGYFFATPVNNAEIRALTHTGNWALINTVKPNTPVSKDVFTLFLNHGAAPANGAYAYIIVPGLAVADMDAYLAANPIQTLRNDATAQAIRQSSLDVAQAAFYAPGSVTLAPDQTLSANAKSVVMLRRQPNVLRLSAANPETSTSDSAPTTALTVDLAGVPLSGSSPTWFDGFGTATVAYTLPGGIDRGSTVGLWLSSTGTATPTVALQRLSPVGKVGYSVPGALALPGDTTLQVGWEMTLELRGAISGAGSLTKTGVGTLTLAGANTYTGDTTVAVGTLSLTTPFLADGAAVRLATGTTLHLAHASTDTIRSFSINGILQATGTWGAVGSGATYETSLITGPGRLMVETGAPPNVWTSRDIGGVGAAGSSSIAGGVHTISGSGTDIWDAADEFRFVYQPVTGDCDIRARVVSQTDTHESAKAGVMIRSTLDGNSAHAMTLIMPRRGYRLSYRKTPGGSSASVVGPATNPAPNNWVRLVRVGNTFTSYISANGTDWTNAGSVTIAMGATVQVGLAVTSHVDATLSTAKFDHVSIVALRSPWQSQDVGAVEATGSAIDTEGVYALSGSGADLTGTADEFRYAYQTASGDCEVQARVTAVGNTGAAAKVGVMIRETLNANSSHVAVMLTASNGIVFQHRNGTGATTTLANIPGPLPPHWLRVVRSGDTFTGYRSTDGINWTSLGTATIPMGSDITIGLAATSAVDGTVSTSTLDNVTVIP